MSTPPRADGMPTPRRTAGDGSPDSQGSLIAQFGESSLNASSTDMIIDDDESSEDDAGQSDDDSDYVPSEEEDDRKPTSDLIASDDEDLFDYKNGNAIGAVAPAVDYTGVLAVDVNAASSVVASIPSNRPGLSSSSSSSSSSSAHVNQGAGSTREDELILLRSYIQTLEARLANETVCEVAEASATVADYDRYASTYHETVKVTGTGKNKKETITSSWERLDGLVRDRRYFPLTASSIRRKKRAIESQKTTCVDKRQQRQDMIFDIADADEKLRLLQLDLMMAEGAIGRMHEPKEATPQQQAEHMLQQVIDGTASKAVYALIKQTYNKP